MWWISLTPLACNFILTISQGYRIREMILAVLFLPVIFFIFHTALNSFFFNAITLHPLIIKLFSLIAFLIVLPILINHKNSSNAIMSYFPKNGVIKPRDHQRFFFSITQLVFFGLYFYLVIGINALGLLLVSMNIMFAVILLVCCGSVFIVKKRT